MTSVILYARDTLAEITFPITPAQIKATSAAVTYRFSESRRGGISRARGRQESEYSFSCRLPGVAQSALPHVHDWQAPAQILKQLDDWANSISVGQRTPLTLSVPEKNVLADVYLGDYNYTFAGPFGDVLLDMHLVEFRPLTIDVTTYDSTVAADQTTPASRDDRPDDPPIPATYTVQPGDTLYTISLQTLGDGALWQQIYNANVSVIGPSPNLIQPGMVLSIPGGQPDAATATNVPTANQSRDNWWIGDTGSNTGAPTPPVGGGPF